MSCYNTTLQLRNTVASEITKATGDIPGPVEDEIPDGCYIIYNPNSGKAMSSNATGTYYRAGTDVTVENGKVLNPTRDLVWTVKSENGVYTITSSDGQKLSVNATNNSLPLDDVNDTWKIEKAATEGCYYLINANRSDLYVEWFVNTSKNYEEFTTYYYKADNEALHAMQLIPTDAVEPVDPTIADGDYVVYVPAYSKALSAVYSGYYNSGVDMTLNGQGTFDKVSASEVWTLTNNTDGTFTLTSKSENQKLGMADGNSSMPLGGVNDTWTVEDAGNGLYYVKNVGRKVYIEWYAEKGNFSGFGYINSGTEGMFAIQFVPVTESQIEYPSVEPGDIVDGKYFIYSATAQGVMRYVNAGGAGAVSVTIENDKVVFIGDNTGTGVYTIRNIPGGKYTIQLGSLYLGENSGEELTLNETKDASCEWIIAKAEGYDGYTIMNANVKYYNSATYLEYYASRGFCMYTMKELSDLYIFNFYDASGVENNEGYVGERPGSGDLPTAGTYLVYNPYAEYVMGPQGGDDTARNISVVEASLVEENGEKKLDAGNGALIFTVEIYNEDGETYYSFKNNGKYLATDENDGESNAETLFLQENLTDYCKWSLEETEGGYVMYNKLAAYKGSRVCIEYFSGAFSGWTYKGGTNELFAFQFYPVADTYNTGYVVNPKVKFLTEADANLGLDFTVEFKLDDLGEIQTVTAAAGGKSYTVVRTGYDCSVTIPATDLEGQTSLELAVSVTSKQGTAGEVASYTGTKTYAIKDEPVIVSVSPASMSSVPSGTVPEIAVEFANAGKDPVISLTLNGKAVACTVDGNRITYKPDAMTDGKYVAVVTITRADGKKVEKTWTFNVGTVETSLYFGQLHSHTAEYSDGAGTLKQALEYIASLPASASVQFVAFTDHSNYFDSTSAANPAAALYDTTQMTAASTAKWNTYKSDIAAFNAEHDGLIALGGFEMTWSGGPGHINTFNTPGIVSRNNTDLNNKTNNAGMLAYYDLNVEANSRQESSVVSQFNHPGTTFGFFDSFTGWTEARDEVMTLIEVGNGEGAVGSNGYFPSYEYYDMALSMGWHVAPTNNQDNHKGTWGNANTCRSVIMTDDFTEAGLYEAMAQRRVYSTEDQNLSIVYTLNDVLMGGIIDDFSEDTVKIAVSLSDSDSTDTIGTVAVIGESGRVLYTFDRITSNTAELEVELENTSAYYYIRVTEGDGDIAVTAPIWVDQVAATKTNVTASVADEGGAVVNQEDTVTVTIQNSEDAAITVTGYSISVDGQTVETQTVSDSVASNSSKSYSYSWTPADYGTHAVQVVFNVTVNGEAKTVTASKNIYVKGVDYDTVVTIAEAKKGAEKAEFTVEGIVTSHASGYDQDNAFFDCIYIQDATGGLNIFPVAGNYQIGQKVRVHGAITYYCGEIELNLSEDYGGMIEVISDEITPLAPTVVSCKNAMADEYIGLLMQVSGTITRVHTDSAGVIDRIYVDDGSGTPACLYINGYIKNSQTGGDGFSGAEIKVGSKITAIGIGSVDVDELGEVDYLHRLRVRDRAELVCTEAATPVTPPVIPVIPVLPVTPVTPVAPVTPDEPAVPVFPFVDVAADSWYRAAVEYAYENGLFAGVSETAFAPAANMSRAMLAMVLHRLSGAPAAGGQSSFTDVADGAWYAEAVVWAAQENIVTGYGDGLFGPADLVTREQAVAMLYRYCAANGIDVSARGDLSQYPDSDKISSYAEEAMSWAIGSGVLTGRDTGLLDPRGYATRAEMAIILQRFCESILKK